MPLTLIPFLLLVVPIVEIAVFIVIGGRIGIGLTLALIFGTAIVGSLLLRVQGFAVLERISREIRAERLPGRELGDGVMILVAGILLLTPGFVTDSIGFALFVPAVRGAVWRFAASRIVAVNLAGGPRPESGRGGKPGDRVLDLDPDEFEEKGDPDSPGSGSGR